MIEEMVAPSGMASQLDPAALDALYVTLPGRVFTPDDPGYDAARAGFSLLDQPTPAVVVAATRASDVVAAVNFARNQSLPIGVRATGHNFGFPYDGGLMINTEQMQGVSIDPIAQTARVEAGVRWDAVIAAAHAHGLAPLNGSSVTVGVVGYTLFGGFGWLLRQYGAAVDSVISADIVTADGQLRHVSATSDPDLFWAIRGASGNFGVVTALEFKLYPVKDVYGGALTFSLERGHEILTAYSQWVNTVPESLTSSITLLRLPPLPHIPEPVRGKAVIVVRAACTGSAAEGAALLAPLRAPGGVLMDTFGMLPYSQIGMIANDPTTPGRSRRSTMMLKDLSPATIETLLRVNGPASDTPVSVFEIRHLGGAMTRVHPDAASFSQRYAPFLAQTICSLANPEQTAIANHNTEVVSAAMQAHSTGGAYPSWLGGGDFGVERMRAGFSPEHYARLVELKTAYDPTNMFRLNHNIPPR